MVLLFLILTLCYSILIFFEIKRFKTFFTPFNLFSFPYIVISIILYLLNSWNLFFYKVDLNGFLLNYLYIAFFYIGSIFFLILKDVFSLKNTFNCYKIIEKGHRKNSIINDALAFVNIIISIIIFFYIVKSILYIKGTYYITRQTMQEELSYGFIGHLTIFLLYYTNFLVLSKKEINFSKILILLTIILLLLNSTKYFLLIYIFSIYLSFYSGKFLRIRDLFLLFLFALISFVIIYFLYSYYLLENSKEEISEFLKFIFQHLLLYIISPIYNSSLILDLNLFINDYNKIFSGIVNIKEFILGSKNYVSGIVDIFIPFYKNYLGTSNVFGFIGDLLIKSNNYMFVFLMVIITSLISYLIFFLAIYTNSTSIKAFNNINLSVLLISFFSFWYGNLFFLEISFVFLVFGIFEITIKKAVQ